MEQQHNQQWTRVISGSYSRFKNRATGLYLDGMGRTSNGSDLGQWSSSSSNNQQFQLISTSSIEAEEGLSDAATAFNLYPNPVEKLLSINLPSEYQEGAEINIYNNVGKLIFTDLTKESLHIVNLEEFPAGL